MAPLRRKKARVSQLVEDSPLDACSSATPNRSPSRIVQLNSKSSLHRVVDGNISKKKKLALIENLKLEIAERARKLRSQYATQAHALKQRIAMRINRVPKKLWKVTMGDLLSQVEGNNSIINAEETKALVQDVQRLSHGEPEINRQKPLVVPKKRTAKKNITSAREKMPPPPVPSGPLGLSTSRKNLPPSSSPQESRSPRRPISATKMPRKDSQVRTVIPSSSSSSSTRATSRATTRSSIETVATSAGSSQEGYSTSTRGTKSSQAKAKAAAAAAGLKRGGVKGIGSNGSLKENKVAGVKEPTKRSVKKVPTSTGSGRVLRSRK